MITTKQQTMAEFNFVELSKELDDVEETGVSFEGKTQKWETENDVKSLIEQINKCTKLVYLNLEGNTLGVEAAKTIGTALETRPEFKKALWKDLFTGRLKEEIPQALKYLGQGIVKANARLTVLDCSDNALGPNGMVGLVDLLKSTACYSLQELKLNNCGLGIDGGKMLAKALLDCHQKSYAAGTPLSLKVFIAGRNRLENEGAAALAKVFSTIKTLEEIVMPQNGIYHAGITALSEGFKANENIKILNLNDNTITAKGAVSLAAAFSSMQKLREVNFGDCLLKTKGVLLLADALQDEHPDLEVLNLSANEINVDGGLAIAAAVRNKTKIRSVVLEGNNFGYVERERIKEAMEECPNADVLEGLSGDECDLDEEDEYSEENSEEEDEDGDTDVDQCADSEDEEEVEDVNYVTALTSKTVDNTFNTSNPSNDSSICFTGVEERPNTIETFCNTPNPSIKMFNALEESNKIEAFQKYLENYKDEDYIICLVFTILKCSALAQESAEALSVAEALYKDVFEYAQQTNQVTRVKNFFLIQLGLLKCEDKTFKPAFNMKACRYALKETIKKNSFPDDISNTFKLFLDRFAV